MIKLIASDLDGTIIADNNSISQDNLNAINNINKKNIPLVICTGKTYAISKDLCQKLHASFGIFGNGSQIIDLTTGAEIARAVLSHDEIQSCLSVAEKYNLHIHAYTENSIISSKLLYMDLRNSILFPNKVNFEIVPSVSNYIEHTEAPILKLILSSTSSLSDIKDDLEKTNKLTINHICKTGVYRDLIIDKEYEYLDISPNNVTKGSALQILSNYLNLQKENILSIGDNINDIDMFKVSNIGAALSNANDNVKSHATFITKNSVENGGFAEAIYKFLPF